MTQQNIHKEIESDHAIGDRNNSESKEDAVALGNNVARQPIEEKGGFFEKYCASHPDASQCRVYDV